MEELHFYSHPKTGKVIFLNKEYDHPSKGKCFRYVTAQHFPDPNKRYYTCSFAPNHNLGEAYSWKVSEEVWEKALQDPSFRLSSGETDNFADGNWYAWYATNPFFQAGTREDWVEVTPSNASPKATEQILWMIEHYTGKKHNLMIKAWTLMVKAWVPVKKAPRDQEGRASLLV